MCGIVAYFTGYNNGFMFDEAKAFTDMLFVDTLRGWDSTGAFSVSNKGNVHMLKAALTGPDFIAHKDYKEFNSDAVREGLFMVGHNRAATRGTINDANAHPFVIDDNIILVQNGTWNGSHNHVKDTEVDTETVAHIIHEEADIEKALQKINAAYALMWYNVKEKAMYAIRNSQRPLWTVRTKRGGEMLASEPTTILFAAMRQNIELAGKPYEIKPGHLCKWAMDEQGSWDYAGQDVDYMYKHVSTHSNVQHYQGGQSNQNFPIRHSFHGSSATNDDVTDVYPNVRPHRTRTPSNKDINTSMTEVVSMGAVKDWEMAHARALDMHKDFGMRNSEKELAVEWVDYVKCNNRPDCSAFYIVGRPLTTDSSDEPSALVYTIVTDVTEEQAMNMVGHSIYSVKPSTALMQRVRNTENYVVSVYCHSVKKLNLKDENASTTPQLH